jgi:hypothetical protein
MGISTFFRCRDDPSAYFRLGKVHPDPHITSVINDLKLSRLPQMANDILQRKIIDSEATIIMYTKLKKLKVNDASYKPKKCLFEV